MSILAEVTNLLDASRVRYRVRCHAPAFSASRVAAAEHVPGRHFAKVVIVKARPWFAMAVVPATEQLDVHKLPVLGARLASEAECRALFPQCEVGAMPPFGNLYGLPVFVDDRLMAGDEIVFEAGNHVETVHLATADFRRLVHPIVGDYALRHEAA